VKVSRRSFLGGAVGSIGLVLWLRALKPTMWVNEIDAVRACSWDLPVIERDVLSRRLLVYVEDVESDLWLAHRTGVIKRRQSRFLSVGWVGEEPVTATEVVARREGRYFVPVHPDVAAMIRSWD